MFRLACSGVADLFAAATATSAPVAKKAKVTKGKKAADRSASEDNGDDDEEAAVKKELAGNDDEDAF